MVKVLGGGAGGVLSEGLGGNAESNKPGVNAPAPNAPKQPAPTQGAAPASAPATPSGKR
jgi:hypothetical protein